jgi:hypothetical protein
MSADPTLKRTLVRIDYTSSDGYRADAQFKGGTGSKHRVTGEEILPEKALLGALEELARLTALFGFEDQAMEKFNGARQRVFEWRATRAAKATGEATP